MVDPFESYKLYNALKLHFETDYDEQSISESEKAKVISQTIGVWEAEDEDHLIELISDESGWLVEDLAYETLNE